MQDGNREFFRPALTPVFSPVNVITHQTFVTIEDYGHMYMDQTGRFPIISSSENQYVLIMCIYDVNAILAHPIKHRSAGELLCVYTHLFNYISTWGFKPQSHWLDNEAPEAVIEFDRMDRVHFQLVPPYIHHTNTTERAVHTWKNHFVAGLFR